jgi:two-component system chemotaxis sensor kinase CheA
MSLAIEGLDEIIKEFLVESTEGLDLLDRDLVALEQDPSSRELLAEVFRAVHTIKGTSGVLGYPKLEKVAHVGENLLSRMRDGKLLLNPATTSGLLAMVDALRRLLSEIEQHGNEGAGEYGAVVQRLEALLNQPQASPPQNPSSTQAPAVQPLAIPKSPAVSATAQSAEFAEDTGPAPKLAIPPPAAAPVEGAKDPAVSGSNIRVDVGLLDKMMNLVGELVLARNQILQCSSSQSDATFFNAAQRLNLITTELQEGVMKTRMQPIGNVWSRFPRLVRDLALQCGKQVTIEMEGSETELDKTIIEAIKDPLTHILRNSLDHGIETPEERRRAGKMASGRLHLRAYHEGGQVNIEISDDGAGVDLERVKQRAVQRGIVGAQQADRMSDRELTNLVFLPGFSTAEKVSNVSGRGVGMDVVKTNIEKIGGAVDLQSVRGQGTTLKIKIPLTLAIIPALVVSSGRERFAIPQVSLLELVRLEDSEGSAGIEHIQGVPVHRLRGRLLPLVFLNRELRLQEQVCSTAATDTDDALSRSKRVDFDSARSAHQAWGKRLRELLDGSRAITVEEVGTHQACALGRWLYGSGLKEYHHLPQMIELERVHTEFHDQVREIVIARNNDDDAGEKAEQGYSRIQPLSQHILTLLTEVEQQVLRSGAKNIVVLQADGRQFGLVVDEINDTEEIVVKPLGKQLKGISCFAGATIMGDGQVALILDVLGIAQMASVVSEVHDQAVAAADAAEAAARGARQSWLLFRSTEGSRLALPLSAVARLEEFPLNLVEHSGNDEVVQYRGEIMPLLRVSRLLHEKEAAGDPLQVVVFSARGRSLGLVVDRIEDITDEAVEVRDDERKGFLLGSAVIQQKVTDIVDLQQVVAQAAQFAALAGGN